MPSWCETFVLREWEGMDPLELIILRSKSFAKNQNVHTLGRGKRKGKKFLIIIFCLFVFLLLILVVYSTSNLISNPLFVCGLAHQEISFSARWLVNENVNEDAQSCCCCSHLLFVSPTPASHSFCTMGEAADKKLALHVPT